MRVDEHESGQARITKFRGSIEARSKALVERTQHGLFTLLAEKFSSWPAPVRAEIDARVEAKMEQGYLEKHRTRIIAWAQSAFLLDWIFGYLVTLDKDGIADQQALLAHHRCYATAVAKLERDLEADLAAERELDAGESAPWEEV